MSELQPRPEDARERIEAILARLRALTDDEVKQSLARCLGLSADSFLEAACHVKILEEERGLNLADLKSGMLDYLRMIAFGQVLPEIVVKYIGHDSLIRRIARLPLSEQRRLAAGEPIKLLVLGDDGRRTHRLADLKDMTPAQVRQALADNHIRTEAEQALLLDEENRERLRPLPEAKGAFTFDKELEQAICKGQRFSIAELETGIRLARVATLAEAERALRHLKRLTGKTR